MVVLLVFFLFTIGILGSLYNTHCIVRFLLSTEVILIAGIALFLLNGSPTSFTNILSCVLIITLASVELAVGLKLFSCNSSDESDK
ncbi:MAG: hypothetical protein K6C34_04775 [Alphaproteobacteria bacterium]|nr:hypothetical protein [Alphaproteobacteria bacterium]